MSQFEQNTFVRYDYVVRNVNEVKCARLEIRRIFWTLIYKK